jgi:iron complex outermembrane receptor protein
MALPVVITGFWSHDREIMGELSIYSNFNFTDTRQTRFGSIYTGSLSNPVFKDIFAPLDGFVVNAGIKIKI